MDKKAILGSLIKEINHLENVLQYQIRTSYANNIYDYCNDDPADLDDFDTLLEIVTNGLSLMSHHFYRLSENEDIVSEED